MAAEGASQLLSVVTLLGAAIVAVPIFKRIGLGSVLGYLAAGLAIGPFGFGLFSEPQSIIHIAELGVVMFLFIIGLEMKPSHLWGLRRQIFGLGSAQVVVSAILLTFVAMAFDFPWQVAFIAGAGFVLTSTAIVMQVLSERGDMASYRGQKMISILLFEDLIIVPLLAVVSFLAPADATTVVDTQPIWQKIGIAGLSVTALVVAGIWLLNPLFRILAKTKIRELMTAVALFVVLGSAWLMEEGGLSTAMGAFVAGVLLSESSFRHQLEADIEPFRGLLLGLFFLGDCLYRSNIYRSHLLLHIQCLVLQVLCVPYERMNRIIHALAHLLLLCKAQTRGDGHTHGLKCEYWDLTHALFLRYVEPVFCHQLRQSLNQRFQYPHYAVILDALHCHNSFSRPYFSSLQPV